MNTNELMATATATRVRTQTSVPRCLLGCPSCTTLDRAFLPLSLNLIKITTSLLQAGQKAEKKCRL